MSIITTRPPERHLGDACECSRAEHQNLALDRIVAPSSENDCWLWLLKPNKHGYGALWHAKRAWLAHRFTYEALVGRIPDGLSLDHLCRNRICVNPDHLEPVTYEENWKRGRGAGARWKIGEEPSPIPDIPRRAYRSRDGNIAVDDPRHGTTTGYSSLRCRCQPCRAAHAVAERERLRRRGGDAA